MDRIRLAMDRIKWLWTESDWLWTESNGYGQNQIGYGQNQTMMVIEFVCYKAWKATVVSRLAMDRIKP